MTWTVQAVGRGPDFDVSHRVREGGGGVRGTSEHNLLFHPWLLGKTPVCPPHCPFHLLILSEQLPPP